jgi:hypothetical protein
MLSSRFVLNTYRPLLHRIGVLAGVSLVLGILLVVYVFGVQNELLARVFGAFFLFFWLLAVTFLGVVPFINWATANWFGPGWAVNQPKSDPRARSVSVLNSSSRKPARTAPHSDKKPKPRP